MPPSQKGAADMDVKNALLLIPLLWCLACNNERENEDAVTRPKKSAADCEPQEIPGEFLVKWKDDSITIVKDQNENHFVNNFFAEHKLAIAHAEPHYRIDGNRVNRFLPLGFGGGENWGVAKVEAERAWQQGYRGQGVIVAVIDSGFDTTHPLLQEVMAANPNEIFNGLDDDGNGLVDDVFGYDFVVRSGEVVDRTGHGTHVAGIIVADHRRGAVLGVAPEAKLLPLTFIDETETGSINSAINAIRYAAARGAQVVNASWGGEFCSLALKQEIKSLEKSNILFISASGNASKNLEIRPEYPAAFALENHISVGASTFSDQTAGFSNYGEPVAIVAPGANIISTIPLDYDFPTCNDATPPQCVADGLASLDGTSMAAPFVSAAAALLWSAKPDAPFTQIKKALLEGANIGPFPVSTRGRLDVEKSLEILLSDSLP